MQIEDVLKLYLQGIMGPAHNINSYEKCLKRTIEEYNNIENKKEPKEIEEIISDKYVRIHLCPYYKKERNFELLVKYFIESSRDKNDLNEFFSEVKTLINNENKKVIEDYLSRDDYLISHSQIYKENYHPHYLVINRKYIKNIYKN